MTRLRTAFLGGVLGGVASALLAPRLGGARRGPLARFAPLTRRDRRIVARFAGTPCAVEASRGEQPLPPSTTA
jgi:hypothetical protein